MLYSFFCVDNANSLPLRLATRNRHIERLKLLQQQGRLVLAGPNPIIDSEVPGDDGFSGSLIVAEFASLEDARSWADQDPYQEVGIYSEVIVKPFIQALP